VSIFNPVKDTPASEKWKNYAVTDNAASSDVSDGLSGLVHDWGDVEEKGLVRKQNFSPDSTSNSCRLIAFARIDMIVMPLMMLAFFSLQLNCGNM
jgi:hypothetical protein